MEWEEWVDWHVRAKSDEDGVTHYFAQWGSDEGQFAVSHSDLVINAQKYPPGTKITVDIPLCPDCKEEVAEAGKEKCSCGFSWKDWVDQNYIH